MTLDGMAEFVKTSTRPFLVVLLALGWIIMIMEHVSVPMTYEGITVAAVGEWVLERGYKRLIKKEEA